MTHKPIKPIVLTGSISIDRIMNFTGSYKDIIKPDKLHVLSLSVLINSLVNSHGGTAANIAYSLALLQESPILLGSIGNDATNYLTKLTDLGINTDHTHISNLPTATFTVLTDQTDCQIGGFYPGAMSDSDSLTLEPWLQKDPLVVISANDPATMLRLTQECNQHNLNYIYDPGQQVSNISANDIRAGIESCEILICNDYELSVICEKSALSESELTTKIPIIITTLGAQGSRITGSSLTDSLTIPAVPDLTILDPTGAGDAYRSGLIYGYTRSWSLIDCARLGSVTASFACSKKGTQEHTFSLKDVKDLYKQIYKTNLPK